MATTQSELAHLIQLCRSLFDQHGWIDYYATTVGIGLVIVLGVLGNAGTLLTLSGRRLTTATFVYYRAIAFTDLIRCLFVFSYVLRVVVPFRKYYTATWYEAHLLYFLINILSFVSTALAVTLCVRLCIGILQSRRLKKTKTNPKTTKGFIYLIVLTALLVNSCLWFEYEVASSVDYCSRNKTTRIGEYMIKESSFHAHNVGLLRAIHLLPIVILLALLFGAGTILGCCLYAMPRATRKSPPPKPPPTPSSPKSSTNAVLLHHCPSVRYSRPWRTQRQLCKLFLLLSFCYALGLFPEFLNMLIFSKIDTCNCTSKADNYRVRIKRHFDRENFATVSNIFQNIGHALSFYVYILCSEAFRAEFLVKLRRLRTRFYTAIWPYSQALGCTSVGAVVSEKMSQSSDTKHALKSVTLLAELDSEEAFATTFGPELQSAMEMMEPERPFATAVSYSDAPVFTLAALARRMSAQLYVGLGRAVEAQEEDDYDQGGQAMAPSPIQDQNDDKQKSEYYESFASVQLEPDRYQRFYSNEGKRKEDKC